MCLQETRVESAIQRNDATLKLRNPSTYRNARGFTSTAYEPLGALYMSAAQHAQVFVEVGTQRYQPAGRVPFVDAGLAGAEPDLVVGGPRVRQTVRVVVVPQRRLRHLHQALYRRPAV